MPPSAPLRVLIVDDDQVDRMAVRRVLTAIEPSAIISEAADVASAVAAIETHGFDCAVLDFHLPDGDGLGVLAHVRAAGRGPPIIMLTGVTDAQTAVELMKAGATDYIPKAALSPERLERSFRYALRIGAAEQQVRRHTEQLQALSRAALHINATLSVEAMLTTAADEARRLIGARFASTTLVPERPDVPGREAQSVSAPYAGAEPSADAGIVAPLFRRDGATLGTIRIMDKEEGDFTEGDRAIVAQLAQLLSGALENARLFETAHEATRARDDVLAIVSHDLRNPLHTIQMASSLLLDLAPNDDRRVVTRHQVEIVMRSVRRANRLIADLLDATRIEAGTFAITPRPASIEELVREVVELLSPLAAVEGIAVESEVEPGLPKVRADVERVLQVFSNLGGNAVKFTTTGGRITIRAASAGDQIRLSVEDSGAGIAPTDLPHVFDRYWQGRDRARLGAGLGLWIAKGIVEAHNGCISVKSTAGVGTTVSFTLPAVTAPSGK